MAGYPFGAVDAEIGRNLFSPKQLLGSALINFGGVLSPTPSGRGVIPLAGFGAEPQKLTDPEPGHF